MSPTLVKNKPNWILSLFAVMLLVYTSFSRDWLRCDWGRRGKHNWWQTTCLRRGREKEMSADPHSHTHTHREERGYALSHQTQTAHVSHKERSPVLTPDWGSRSPEKQTRHTCGVKSPKGDTDRTAAREEKRLSCGSGTANCSANSLLTGVGSRTM